MCLQVCARAYKQIWYWPNREGLNGTDAIHDDVGRCYLLPSALDDMDEIQVVQACNYFGHSKESLLNASISSGTAILKPSLGCRRTEASKPIKIKLFFL